MPKPIEFLCLANSRKMQGRCIAGLTPKGKWVRLISDRPNGELIQTEYRLKGGLEPEHFDVILAGISNALPESHQPENWVISGTPWQLSGRGGAKTQLKLLEKALYKPTSLFGNYGDRVQYGLLEKTPAEASLALISPENPRFLIRQNFRGNKQIRAIFQFSGHEYSLGVTDRAGEAAASSLAFGEHPFSKVFSVPKGGKVFFVISLSDPAEFDNCCYKLVASILIV